MALTTSPANPAPGDSCSITSSLNTGAVANAVLLEVTSVPSRSAIALGYQYAANDTLPTSGAITPAMARAAATSFTGDVAGEFGVNAHLLYLRSATADEDERIAVKAVDSDTVYVSSTLTLPIRDIRGRGADLVLTVNNLHIRAAELLNPVDERSRLATLTSAVTSAVAALVDVTVVSAFGSLETLLDDLIANANAHFGSTDYHEAEDTTNTISRPSLLSQGAVIAAANLTRTALLGHLDAGGAGDWHQTDDTQSRITAPVAADIGQATVLVASMRAAYEDSHRAIGNEEPVVHSNENGDTVNTLAASPLLHVAIVELLDALSEPTSEDAGEGAGAIYAATEAGFRVS